MKLAKSERITLEVTTFDIDRDRESEHQLEKQYFHFSEISKFHEFYVDNIRIVVKIINQINDK